MTDEGLDDEDAADNDINNSDLTPAPSDDAESAGDVGSIDGGTRDAITRALQGAGTIDRDAITRALFGVRARHDPPEELVSETALDDVVEEDAEEDPQVGEVAEAPAELTELKAALEAQGFAPELRERPQQFGAFELRFDLMAGRSTRSVAVDADGARLLQGATVSAWRSLQRYDGIWSESEGMVEVALRPSMGTSNLSRLVSRLLPGGPDVDPDNPEIGFFDKGSGITIRIGRASDLASVLLSAPYRPVRRVLTVQASNVAVSTADSADDLTERLADALSLDADMVTGVSLVPRRLENRDLIRRTAGRRRGLLTFPRNTYPHAPVLLYQAGRDRNTAPLIRYWSFYQVLEYFFPKHSEAEALRQLSRLLRSPSFDAHRDEDVLKAVQLATSAGKGFGAEDEQLLTTLKAITTPDEVADLVQDRGLGEQLDARNSDVTEKRVNIDSRSELLSQLARRIYDIRGLRELGLGPVGSHASGHRS